VHLFSAEDFWPCDIADHLHHTTPFQNYTPIHDLADEPTIDNLDELNRYGRFTFLQSRDNVEERPNWLGGSKNIPNSHGVGDVENAFPNHCRRPSDRELGAISVEDEEWYDVGMGDAEDRGGGRSGGLESSLSGRGTTIEVRRAKTMEARRVDTKEERKETGTVREDDRGKDVHGKQRIGGHSSAPAVLVVVPKENGVVDAFWFYFYSYNLGNQVWGTRFGNHVGDWEHSVVRFHHGVPKAVFLSEHSAGEAYSYEAVEKIGIRPVIYSAVGTHAMYATPGLHPYVLPWGLLHDETDRGPLWDPLLNHHGYVYNYTTGVLQSSLQTPSAPVSWFNYSGRWGDKIYPISDPRQYRFAGQYHYVTGPLGPKFKNLGRKKVCQGNKECIIKDWIGGKEWPGLDVADGEEA